MNVGLPHAEGRRMLARLILAASAACATATAAFAADDAGRDALDRLRYARSFDAIHDRLAAGEAERAAASAAAGPWTSAALPPPRGTVREVPAAAFAATVAHASVGSWRGPGDRCSMAAAGTVQVLGSAPGPGTLVRYRPPVTASPDAAGGCSDGTMAFVPTDALFGWPDVGAWSTARREVGARLAAAADRILSDQGVD